MAARANLVALGSSYTESLASGVSNVSTLRKCCQPAIRPSRGTVGDTSDNAMAESFCATLKGERLNRRTYRAQAEARLDLFQYLEGWDDPHRRLSALGNQSPITYERNHSAAACYPNMPPLRGSG